MEPMSHVDKNSGVSQIQKDENTFITMKVGSKPI